MPLTRWRERAAATIENEALLRAPASG